MQKQRKLDQNLLFGEYHDKADIKTFLSTHIDQFYQQGYRILVCELNENWPIGDLIDSSLPANSTLHALMQKAQSLVAQNDPGAPAFLDEIENALRTGPWLTQGSDKPSFARLVRAALANKFEVRFFDYINDPGKQETGSERVQKYDDDVAPKLRHLTGKWLELAGNDHVVGIVKRVQGVVGFQYTDLSSALTSGKLTGIQNLEQVNSIP